MTHETPPRGIRPPPNVRAQRAARRLEEVAERRRAQNENRAAAAAAGQRPNAARQLNFDPHEIGYPSTPDFLRKVRRRRRSPSPGGRGLRA